MIRVVLPAHLRALIRRSDDVTLDLNGATSLAAALDALEGMYPVLRGTIRDHVTHRRRPYIRFFACERDLSHDSPDDALPSEVLSGEEPLLVVGAMAGG